MVVSFQLPNMTLSTITQQSNSRRLWLRRATSVACSLTIGIREGRGQFAVRVGDLGLYVLIPSPRTSSSPWLLPLCPTHTELHQIPHRPPESRTWCNSQPSLQPSSRAGRGGCNLLPAPHQTRGITKGQGPQMFPKELLRGPAASIKICCK